MNCLPGHGPPPRDDRPGALLDVMARELRAGGMEVREHQHGIEVVEIAVTNEQDQSKGRVYVGYDGLVTWEYGGDIETRAGIEKIMRTIIRLLASDVAQPNATTSG